MVALRNVAGEGSDLAVGLTKELWTGISASGLEVREDVKQCRSGISRPP